MHVKRSSKEKVSRYEPPDCSKAMARPRLLEMLDGLEEKRLVVINAGAGYGKSTVMAQMFGRLSGRPVWHELSKDDNDSGVFFAHLMEGVRRQAPGISDHIRRITIPDDGFQEEDCASFLTAFVNGLPSESDEAVHFLFDDFHVISNQLVRDAIWFLIQNAPPASRFLIAGRGRPSLSLARFRAHRALLELSGSDLRFTAEEASAFLQHGGSGNNDKQVAQIQTLTEGWPVALFLAREALEDGREGPGLGQAVSESFCGYLADELWAELDAGRRVFFMGSALLDAIDTRICDEVLTTGAGSGATLSWAEEQNLLTERTTDSDLLRFHPLFLEFLTQQFFKEQGAERAGELHLLYAGAFHGRGDNERAIEHYFLASKPERAADLIIECCQDLISSDCTATVKKWLGRLPRSLYRGRPWLHYLKAQIHERRGELAKALKCLDVAQSGFSKQDDQAGLFETGACRSGILLNQALHTQSLKAAEEALEWAREPRERIVALNRVALQQLILGRGSEAESRWKEARSLCDDFMAPQRQTVAVSMLGSTYRRGDFKTLLLDTTRLLERPAASMSAQERFGVLHYRILALFECLRASETLELLAEVEAGPAAEFKGLKRPLRCLKGQNLLLEGRTAEGRRLIRTAINGHGEHRLLGPDCPLNYLGAFERRRGRTSAALCLHQEAFQYSTAEGSSYAVASSLQHIAADRMMLEGGSGGNGRAELEESLAMSKEYGYGFVEVRARYHQAWTALRHGERDEALAALRECLPQANAFGHDRFMAQEGAVTMPLLSLAFEHDLERGFLISILGKIGPSSVNALRPLFTSPDAQTRKMALGAASNIGGASAASHIRRLMRDKDPEVRAAADGVLKSLREEIDSPDSVLTRREMEVLNLMARGMGNDDIARHCAISEPTVKSHVTRIFNKLGLNKRGQVVAYYHQKLMTDDEGGKECVSTCSS